MAVWRSEVWSRRERESSSTRLTTRGCARWPRWCVRLLCVLVPRAWLAVCRACECQSKSGGEAMSRGEREARDESQRATAQSGRTLCRVSQVSPTQSRQLPGRSRRALGRVRATREQTSLDCPVLSSSSRISFAPFRLGQNLPSRLPDVLTLQVSPGRVALSRPRSGRGHQPRRGCRPTWASGRLTCSLATLGHARRHGRPE